MLQTFDIFNQPENPQLILCKVNREQLCELKTAYDIEYEVNLSALNTLSFKIPETVDSIKVPFYTQIESKKLIYFTNLGYFIIKSYDIESDGIREIKNVSCVSYEEILGRRNIVLLEGTYDFYNILTPANTILGKVIELLDGWSIGTIDSSLWGVYRSFDVTEQSVYNFLMSDLSDVYECLFSFDTINKRINATAFDNIGVNTNIFLSHDNLIKSLNVQEDGDNIVTALSCVGSGEVDVSRVNPNGTMWQYNFDYFKTTEYISSGLITKLNAYDSLYDTLQPTYATYLTQLNNKNIDLVLLQTELTDLTDDMTTLEAQLAVKVQESASLVSTNALIAAKQVEINTKNSQISTKQAEIASVTTQLDSINTQLNFETYFTTAEKSELAEITYESSYQDDAFLITDTMTESEKQTVVQALFDKGRSVLDRVSNPKLTLDVDAIDFVKLFDFQAFTSQLNVGDFVTIEYSDGLYYDLRLLNMSHSWTTGGGLNLTFSNRYKRYDGTYNLQDMLNKSLTGSTTLGYSASDYSNWSNNYKDEVTTFINSSLDASVNNLKSNSGNEIVINGNGLRGKKLISPGVYSPKEIWMVNNMIAFSNDSFTTSKMAIGEIQDSVYGSVYGVVADAIVGKLIAGNSLTISNSNNKFIVNATGCTLVDSSMTVTNSTNKSRVLIDPTNGIKIQSNATGSWIDRLYADVNGNLVISAALSAATGTFSGTVSAGAIVGSTINGGSIAIGSRFAVDSLGNMTATNANFSGNITGSTINVTTDTKIGRKLSLGYTGDLDDLPGYQGIHFANVFSPEFGGAYIATQVTTEESLEISGGGFGVTFNDYAVFTENVNFSPSTTVNLTGVNVVGFEAGITSISGGIGIDVVEFDPGELSISLDRLYTDDRYLRNDGTNTYGVATRDSSAYQDLSIAATLTGITIRSGSTVLGSIAYT